MDSYSSESRKWEQANDLFQESMQYDDHLISAMMWPNNAIAQSDAKTGIALLQEWSANHPFICQVDFRTPTLVNGSRDFKCKLNEPVESVEGEETENVESPVEPTEEDIAAKAEQRRLLPRKLFLTKPKSVSSWLENADQTLFIYPLVRMPERYSHIRIWVTLITPATS